MRGWSCGYDNCERYTGWLTDITPQSKSHKMKSALTVLMSCFKPVFSWLTLLILENSLDNKTNKNRKNKTIQWFIFFKNNNQYLVWPPWAITTSRHLFLMEKMRRLHTPRGIASHSSLSASCNCWCEVGRWGRFLILLSSSSQRCSIGFRSGDFEGHGRTGIPMFARWAVVMQAACGLADFILWLLLWGVMSVNQPVHLSQLS